ncbi:MAG: NOP5/NOP56 family protein [archaeon]
MANLEKLRSKFIADTKTKVKETYERRDNHIIRAVSALDQLDEVFNLLFEQISEWYAMHFPELEKDVNSNDMYLRLVGEIGLRENFAAENISSIYKNADAAKKLEKLAKESIGSVMQAADLARIQALCKLGLSLKGERDAEAAYIDTEMKNLLPNFSKLAGTLIGAKMLAIAGSLNRLIKMPASTIQILGAEKALFQHLKTGSKPPKYGLLYQHPLVKKSRPDHKGKVARILASKLSLALKVDYFGKRDISEELEKDLAEKTKNL